MLLQFSFYVNVCAYLVLRIPNNTSKYLPYDAFTTIRQKMGWKNLHKLHFIPNDRRITARQWIEDLRRQKAALKVSLNTTRPISVPAKERGGEVDVKVCAASCSNSLRASPSSSFAISSSRLRYEATATSTSENAVDRITTARKPPPASSAAEKELLLLLPLNAQARDPERFSSGVLAHSCPSEKLGIGGVDDITAAVKTLVFLPDSRLKSSSVKSEILPSISTALPSTFTSKSRAVSPSPSTASTVVVAVRPPMRT